MGISVYVFVCLCAYMCLSVYLCIWVGINLCPMGLCASVCKHVFVCVCPCVRVHKCFSVSMIVYVTLCVLHVPAYLCMYVHVFLGGMLLCTSLYVHVSMCMYVCVTNINFPIHRMSHCSEQMFLIVWQEYFSKYQTYSFYIIFCLML